MAKFMSFLTYVGHKYELFNICWAQAGFQSIELWCLAIGRLRNPDFIIKIEVFHTSYIVSNMSRYGL